MSSYKTIHVIKFSKISQPLIERSGPSIDGDNHQRNTRSSELGFLKVFKPIFSSSSQFHYPPRIRSSSLSV
ncbi:hypothetical protein QYF36_001377 [Acer negundo]|nr:hypothetical protein QYF36_001377 [Acer negundo]